MPLDIAEAKTQLARISEALSEPAVLIGGLAVNQYVTTRQSQDIDLILDYSTATRIVRELFPTKEWELIEANKDDYRPSYIITHRHQRSYPAIKFGPKIQERGPYPYLEWDDLRNEAQPFEHRDTRLDGILVPSIERLCFTKLVSFLGRKIADSIKLQADLADICELTNLKKFRINVLLDLIASTEFNSKLREELTARMSMLNTLLTNSAIGEVVKLFGTNYPISTPLTPSRVALGSTPPIDDKKLTAVDGLGLVAFDLDGTLIKGIRHSWSVVWSHLGVSSKQKERKRQFCAGEISYLDWCRLDAEDLRDAGLTRAHFSEIASKSRLCSLTKNLRPAIQSLRNAGVRTAIISGGVDALLYALLPDAEVLFDDILINRLRFDDTGSFVDISPTEYDWDGGKRGTVGKRRGLERLCEKYGLTPANAAFVGDDVNDIDVMSFAGRRIHYCGDQRDFPEATYPNGIVIIPENDLTLVARYLLNPETEEVAVP